MEWYGWGVSNPRPWERDGIAHACLAQHIVALDIGFRLVDEDQGPDVRL